MRVKTFLYKSFLITASVVVLGSIAMLLIAADKKKGLQTCAGVKVKITTKGQESYVNKEEVLFAMEKCNKAALINQPVQNIDLPKLEKMLESEHWIKNAQLYFDSQNMLNVLIEERTPMARVITLAGQSFYIDDEGKQLPLIEDKVVRLQTVTGFIAAKRWNSSDSALFNDVKHVVRYLSQRPFWNAQVGQIDITPQQNFELIPVIGDHIIKVGRGEKIEEQLHHLMLFYQQVLSKTGFNKYAAIDLRYDRQVIGVKKEKPSAVDSIAFQQKVAVLLQRAERVQIAEEAEISETENNEPATQAQLPHNIKSLEKPSVSVKTKPNPIKTEAASRAPAKQIATPKKAGAGGQKPKAVMPKQTEKN